MGPRIILLWRLLEAVSKCGKMVASTIVGAQSAVLKRPAEGLISAIVEAINLDAPIRAQRTPVLLVDLGSTTGITNWSVIGSVRQSIAWFAFAMGTVYEVRTSGS